MAAATFTKQRQDGNDVSTSRKTPSKVQSSRTEDPSLVTTITDGGPEVTTTTTPANTTKSVQMQRIGATLTFTLKIINTPPPKALAR